ncbi:MAG: Gfo/Idh/MocA family oxidoreductase [Lachnospiraceae bacterium]|nr:Gfo/Idh/MocA family oxidoreductase [Lachnospiraceae bacterium]
MKLAFIGAGKIVTEALYATEPVKGLEKMAIFELPEYAERAYAFQKQYGIKEVYTDYDELLEKCEADTVYIGLINSAHYEYSKKALIAGKNVILEKPFTLFYDQAEELAELAEKNGVFIVEAITVLHNDVFDVMKKNLEKIGPVRLMMGNYSQYSSRYDKYLNHDPEPVFDLKYYGGSLGDIDVYCIHYAAGLFGRPEKVQYFPNKGYNGADTSGMAMLLYDGFSCVLAGAKDSDGPCFIAVQGETGHFQMTGKPNLADNLTTVYVEPGCTETVLDAAGAKVRKSVTETYESPERYHRMTQEFEDFCRIMDEKDEKAAKALLQETLDVVWILEEARKSAGIVFER